MLKIKTPLTQANYLNIRYSKLAGRELSYWEQYDSPESFLAWPTGEHPMVN
jgi:hypothetical protein